jgi:integrase
VGSASWRSPHRPQRRGSVGQLQYADVDESEPLVQRGPAKVGVDNPTPRRKEQHPFETWEELEAVAAALGPRYGPMILFAAATGLRPAEWVALEWRDIDRDERVAYVRRSYTRRELKLPKTEASLRAVPLQGRAIDALDQLSESDSQLVFPGERGGYLDMHNFRPHQWRPAQKAAGISRLRRVYDLRHTFATFALRAAFRPSTCPDTWAPA